MHQLATFTGETETYPHAIVYDFEAYQDTSKAVRLTSDLFYESEHVPISVSLADTLNPEPEYIVSRDPAELIRPSQIFTFIT